MVQSTQELREGGMEDKRQRTSREERRKLEEGTGAREYESWRSTLENNELPRKQWATVVNHHMGPQGR